MERYGMPYKGSKRALAGRIVALLPEAEILIDAFGAELLKERSQHEQLTLW